MSVSALSWAFAQQIRPATHKLVLITLAWHAEAKTGDIFPSISKLKEKTGLEKRAVFYALADLKKRGLIKVVAQRTGRTKSLPVYHLNDAPTCTNREEIVHLHALNGAPTCTTIVHEPLARISVNKPIDRNEPLEVPLTLSLVPGILPAWKEFKLHRVKLRKPMTPHAEQIILSKLAQRPKQAVAAIELSIERGWQGIEWDWFDRHLAGNERNGKKDVANEGGGRWRDSEDDYRVYSPCFWASREAYAAHCKKLGQQPIYEDDL